MDVGGSAVLAAPAEAVFDALCDPAVLLEVIPGCEGVELTSTGDYRARFGLQLPGLAGGYAAIVRLAHAERPRLGELEGRVEGRAGTVAGRATFRLTEIGPDRTAIEYHATASLSGPLARLDGRFVDGLVRSLVEQGLERLGRRLADGRSGASPDIVEASR